MAGAGTGSRPCSRVHRPAARIDRRAVDLLDAEQLERQAGAHDIGDGIGRADLVEVYLFDRHPMDGGFGGSEPFKDGLGMGARALGQFRAVDHLEDMRQVPVGLLLAACDVKLGGGDPASLHLLEAKRGSGRERVERLDDSVLIGAGVGQRPDSHITTDAGKGVEIADGHGEAAKSTIFSHAACRQRVIPFDYRAGTAGAGMRGPAGNCRSPSRQGPRTTRGRGLGPGRSKRNRSRRLRSLLPIHGWVSSDRD